MLALIRRIPEEMKARIIGQDHAVEEIAEELQNDMLNMRDRSASSAFMLFGPTGVGKTETVRAVAAVTKKKFLRIDMSEFMEKHSVSRLIGSPPGYVGYEEAGVLSEAVRRFPDHVILLDEVEKAHPEVFNILLSVLDHGMLTDGQGRTVDFRNTMIFMTSNLGSGKKKANPIGFVDNNGSAAKDEREQTLEEVRGMMRPELIGRISEERMIVYNQLTENDLEKIVELPLNDLRRENLAPRGMTLTVTPAARKAILTHSFKNREFGARPLRQIIFRAMSRAITRAMLAGTIKDGDPVIVDWDAAAQVFVASRAP
jgi:ATP-dependent Clp protease ATP-binding subunit ClpA